MNNIKADISNILKDLGIPASYGGYYYLRSAIEFASAETFIRGTVTKDLYPRVAKMHGVSSARVERAMRHAISEGWTRGNMETLQRMFGYSISRDRGQPTNSEFIATVADYLNTMGGYNNGTC